ncbi:MAG TPA: histidine phosphatase family protein, partial [Saprospiraceae bacterium]|nr:histidine phosphatase family protein [Saprospiraceae bacterium]
MSKKIFFGRHAKSSWEDFSLSDHDRPLNKRGVKDANLIGNYLKSNKLFPDIIISSSAKRAKSTATIYNEYFNCKIFELEKELYLAPPYKFLEIASEIPDKFNSVLMLAHNPGITELANMYSDEFISNVPTSGIFLVEYDCDTWQEISTY